MDDDREMENFGMDNDYEGGQFIDGEFYYKNRKEKRTQTRDDVLYGVFAGDSSDSDYGGLGSSKKRRKNKDLSGKADFTKPVSFVSTGTAILTEELDQNSKEEKLADEEVDRVPSGLGFDTGSTSKTALDGDVGNKNEEDELWLTSFGKKIKEGAELRREKKKKPLPAKNSSHMGRKEPHSGDLGSFEMHTKGIGKYLLEKMGYKEGRGLGKNEQGIVTPVEAKLRPSKMGMGFNNYEETKSTSKMLEEVSKPGLLQPVQPAKGLKMEELWSKKAQVKKKDYITADELLAKKQEQSLEGMKIFDMRGPQVRVLTNLENLNAEDIARENDVPMPELQHNVRLILESAELDILNIDRGLRSEMETVASLEEKDMKLQDELSKQKQQLDNMQDIVSALEQIGEQGSLGTLTLESLVKSFSDMQKRYADDYKLCNLSCIACAYALPLLIRVFQGWDPLQNPMHGREVVLQWKSLLQEDSLSFFGAKSPYTQLIMEVVFPAVRISGTNTWQARDPEPMLRFLDYWEKFLPPAVLQIIFDSIILPKISSAVDSWDPRQETIPIHSWIHPWLPLLGNKLEPCYQTIRDRLESVLHAWHPSDMSAYYILSPWKTVFDPISWEKLMVRYIVPKLSIVMHEFQINPANQMLDQFYWVRTWATTVPIHHMIGILEIFFTKWHGVLHHWLNSNPNFEEVRKWYLGWKDLLPAELLANEHIRSRLQAGLGMMNQAVEGMEVVPPGLGEHISYQKKHEERQFEKAAAKVHERISVGLGSGFQVPGSGDFEMSLKDVLEVHAQQNGLLFKPKPGRTQDGHQIYGFGSVNIIIDSLNQKVFAQMEDSWALTSLEQLLNLHNRAGLKRR